MSASTDDLVLAIADLLVSSCKRCQGSGRVFSGIGSDTIDDDGRCIAGQVFFDTCDICGALRELLRES